jgi:4-hydroxy-4-methyl-2-oxoglutarate aldolase
MDDIIELFKKLPLGNICDANDKGGNMDPGIKPIDRGCKLAGPAFTVKAHPSDNVAIHKAIYEAPKGSVLVVDAGGFCRGHFGEIMAFACMQRGIAGLVIDGGIRDADEIQKLGFPVFSRGINPGGTQKEVVGVSGQPVICGGLLVCTGDMIIGDRDGVVVVGKDRIQSILEKAQAIAAKEEKVLQMLREGKTTIEIYRFEKLLPKEPGVNSGILQQPQNRE